jgi:dipeptidyl aminopeptidase/acylaminoacyl peptidase
MQGTYDAVVSAAEYLTKLPFVNGKKLGIQGWSFGGWETNYLVTHTKLFAAAAESAGAADIVSKYGSIVRDGSSNQGYYEIGQGRMGGSFFDKQDAYIKNSPVYHLQNVTTPLLIMHNSGDDAVPFSEAMEMFTGLRRLGKKVWVLQYKDGGHGVYGKSAEDFTIRLQQFFDHYLMDKPAPIWMTRGISAEQKGTTDGLQLDTEIKTPGEGLGMPLKGE